jgi:hypothetical protein
MDIDAVPQDNNPILGGHRKGVYARDADGRMVLVASNGWEVEEIVTSDAIEVINALAEAARERVIAGEASALEYWMHAKRMDLDLLAQSSGIWRWRVRRHLRAANFARLSPRLLARYANALGMQAEQLSRLP